MTATHAALMWRGITPPVMGRKTICPQCSAGRSKPDEPCLSIYAHADRVEWRCWHCDWQDGEMI